MNGQGFTSLADSFNKGLTGGISLFNTIQQQELARAINERTAAQQDFSNRIQLGKLIQDQAIANDKGYGTAPLFPGFTQDSSIQYPELTGQVPSIPQSQGNGLFTPINPMSTTAPPAQPQQQDPSQSYYDYFNKTLSKDLPGYTVDGLDLNTAAKFVQKSAFHKGTLAQFRNPENQKLARDIVINGQEKKDVEDKLLNLYKDRGLEQGQIENVKDVLIRGQNLAAQAPKVREIIKKKPYLVGGLNDELNRLGVAGYNPFVSTEDAQDFQTLVNFEGEAKQVKKKSEELGAAVSPYEGLIAFADIPGVDLRSDVYAPQLDNFVRKIEQSTKDLPSFYKKTGKEVGDLLNFQVSSYQNTPVDANTGDLVQPSKPSLQELFKSDPGSFIKSVQQEILNRTKAKQSGFKVSDPQPGVNFTPDTGLPQKTQAQDINGLVMSAADKYKIDPRLLKALVQQESGGNPRAKSKAGAMGVMQLMPATAKAFGVTDPYDAAQNIDAGARYLSQLIQKYNGNVALALAHYNGGGGAVKHFQKKGGIGLRNPYAPANSWDNQTAGYVNNILGAM